MNKMIDMPIKKLIMNLSMPIMLALFIQALYNIVDSIYVANYSKQALDAISVSYPINMLVIAISVGSAIGMGSLLGKRLGETNHKQANTIMMHGIIIAIFSYIILVIIILLYSNKFISIFTNDINLMKDANTYMIITIIGSIGVFISIMLERVFQATGKTILNLRMQVSGALINIILDPIFIYGLLGVPELGIKGAALATITGQTISAIIGLILVKNRLKEVELTFKGFKFDINIIKDIYKVGFPSILMQSVATIMIISINFILAMESETAISVYGLFAKLQQFILMPMYGLGNGLVAIVAYNYGAKKQDRIKEAIKITIIIAMIIMLIGTILFNIFNYYIIKLFSNDINMINMGMIAIKILSLTFPLVGLSFILGSCFQGLGNGINSLIISLLRGIIILIPVAYILYIYYGINNIWYAFIISESIGATLAIIFYYRVRNNILNSI